jgi:hypothetical protein
LAKKKKEKKKVEGPAAQSDLLRDDLSDKIGLSPDKKK